LPNGLHPGRAEHITIDRAIRTEKRDLDRPDLRAQRIYHR
jgi:hypothetical protein